MTSGIRTRRSARIGRLRRSTTCWRLRHVQRVRLGRCPRVSRNQPASGTPAGSASTQSRIVPGGTRVYHYLNNARILEYELDSPELRAAIEKSKFKEIERFGKLQKGHILLQDHGDQVWYRNIKIQRLTP